MPTNLSFLDILKRPEVITLIVAGLVTAAVQLHLPEAAGLALPEGALQSVVAVAWSVFIGAVFEGKFRGIDYVATLRGLFVESLKMRALYLAFGVTVLGGIFKATGHEIPEETLAEIVGFFVPLVLGKAAVDGAQVALKR